MVLRQAAGPRCAASSPIGRVTVNPLCRRSSEGSRSTVSFTRASMTSRAAAVTLAAMSIAAVPAEARAVTPSAVPPSIATAVAITGSAERDSFEARVLRLTNAARSHKRKCGGKRMKKARALVWSPVLASSANAHSADMAANDFFSHNSRSGASPFDRMRVAGYRHRPVGENLAAGLRRPAAVMKAWLRSPGHCRAIMDRRTREIGIGRVAGSGKGSVYWTVDFGALR
jgi:uncharacterized protein YkwD